MTDIYDRETRRRTMQQIRKKNTKPELLVRSVLHQMGLRFRLHQAGLPGVPDIVLPRHRTAILVHGCFWHQHSCKLGKTPKSNLTYWLPKLDRNKTRDEQNQKDLQADGWSVVTLWECELTSREQTERLLRRRLPKQVWAGRTKRMLGGQASQ